LTSALSGSTSSPSANTFITTHASSSTYLLSSPQNLNPAFIDEFQAIKSALEEIQNNHAQFMDQNNSTVEAI
jgi:hypothetical protein